MSIFKIRAKLWPDGTPLDLVPFSSDFFNPPGAGFHDTAAPFMTSLDGKDQYQFLFWNTGRRLTKKRTVSWAFSVPGWDTWNATKWYGKLSRDPGSPPQVRADAFTISDDAPLSGTPIDATASTYSAGAYPPPSGDDHVIGTANGGANVIAKDPFPGYGIQGPQQITVVKSPPVKGSTNHFSYGKVVFSYAVSSCDFAGWLQLVAGGEAGEFLETDTLSDGTSSGFHIYDKVVDGPFPISQGKSADIIAAYGMGTQYINYSPPLREFIYDVPFPPHPLDILKNVVLEALVRLPTSNDLDLLMKDVRQMDPEELGRVMRALEITLDRGNTALTMIKTQMERGGH